MSPPHVFFTLYLFAPMVDMLVRLYELPDAASLRAGLAEQGITIRPCRPYEAHIVAAWVEEHFSHRWVSELHIAMSHQPIGCFIATRNRQVLGFVCVDTTARGFVGPMGVQENARNSGLGKALLLTALEQMHHLGYAYAVIGGVGPCEFYRRTVDAIEIPGSDPGIYADILPEKN